MSRTWHSRKPRKRRICGLCRARVEKCGHLEANAFGFRVHDSIARRHLHRGREFKNKLPYTTRFNSSTFPGEWDVVARPKFCIPLDDPSTL